MRPRDRRLARRQRQLEQRVAGIERLLEPTSYTGPPLNLETLKDKYAYLRERAVRACALRVHPAMSDQAIELAAASNLRALVRVESDEELPPRAWDLVPA